MARWSARRPRRRSAGEAEARHAPSRARPGVGKLAACARRQFDRYSRSRQTAMPRIPVSAEALRRRRPPRAGAADRAGSKFFKAVQSGSKFEVRAFKVCSDFSNFAPPEAQEYRLRSDFLEQPRTRLRNATLPRRCPDRGRRRAMATGIRQVEAPQAQTLRFFRLLRLLGPPPSSKPQRLLAATGPEPTLAADSMLGARHQSGGCPQAVAAVNFPR